MPYPMRMRLIANRPVFNFMTNQSNQSNTAGGSFSVNDRSYELDARPVAVICLDGSADEYLDASIARDRMPNLKRMSVDGYRGFARGALPSFTNVNNTSIVTGAPPATHGICGNYIFDRETGEEVMLNSSRYMRVGTLLAEAQRAGRRVAFVTAKDKLRTLLSVGLEGGGIAFSAEKAREATLDANGIEKVEELVGPTPEIYSGAASVYVLKAGNALVRAGMADFLYLSTTDYMQHTYGPEAPESLDFYAALDAEIGGLLEAGAVVGITADHGMNAKQKPDGSPNVIYLETMLHDQFDDDIRVILPITDPYVKHHGALGSFAVVHLPEMIKTRDVKNWLLNLDGVTEVMDRETAARKLELPEDRLGELVVMSARDVVLGRTPAHHDLSQLDAGLRSHGGRYEEMVPFVISHPLNSEYLMKAGGDPRNFDIFDFTINGTRHD